MRALLFPPLAALSTAFFSLLAVAGGLVRAPPSFYDWVHRNWSRSLFALGGIAVRLEGEERLVPREASIVAANHQSMFDIWALMAVLPLSLRFVTKQELSRIPVFARACRAAGHVFIDRQDRVGAIEAIRKAGERMRHEGLSLVFFPEGTRSRDGGLGPFKRGTFVLAIETQAPLVPVAIEGSREILPPGARTPRRGVIRVACGRPLSLAGKTGADRDAVMQATRGAIAGMLAELRREPPSGMGKSAPAGLGRHGRQRAQEKA